VTTIEAVRVINKSSKSISKNCNSSKDALQQEQITFTVGTITTSIKMKTGAAASTTTMTATLTVTMTKMFC
jgi:hypothetical protein